MNILKAKDKVLISIKRLGINGEGIGYYKRLAVFVDGALAGEEVEIEITEITENYAKGKILKIKKASSHRVKPMCKYFGICGGCELQHTTYASQLNEKRNLVIEAFNRYYDCDVSKINFCNPIGMEYPYEYRNKTSLVLRHDGEKVVTGLYAKGTNRLVFIDECILENKYVRKLLASIRDYLTRNNVSIYNPTTREGIIRFVIIRAFDALNSQVTFVLTTEDKETIKILKAAPARSVFYSINSDPKSIEMFGSKTVLLKGEEQLNAQFGDMNFALSPKSFFQLNENQALKLYDCIREEANLKGDETVFDLYCGIGSIGLYLAKQAKNVFGIDINRDSIRDANEYTKINKINNAKFYAGNIIPYLDQFEEKGIIPDIVIVDPPRKGMDMNLLMKLRKSKIKRIIYVSCNPVTLAKNVNVLKNEYKIEKVRIIDMFPNTANVECVAHLTRKHINEKN